MFQPPLFLLDPVMGDHGRAYSSITETHVQKMKELLPLADIITPNITESCLLTGTPWKDGEWTLQELSGLCDGWLTFVKQLPLHPTKPPRALLPVVLTGVPLALSPMAPPVHPSSSPGSVRAILW